MTACDNFWGGWGDNNISFSKNSDSLKKTCLFHQVYAPVYSIFEITSNENSSEPFVTQALL